MAEQGSSDGGPAGGYLLDAEPPQLTGALVGYARVSTSGQLLDRQLFAALAEFIRELIVEGTREGLDAARARGQRLGRPPALSQEQVRHARQLLTEPTNTVSSIARLLGVSRSTLYTHLPELTGRRVGTVEVARDRAG